MLVILPIRVTLLLQPNTKAGGQREILPLPFPSIVFSLQSSIRPAGRAVPLQAQSRFYLGLIPLLLRGIPSSSSCRPRLCFSPWENGRSDKLQRFYRWMRDFFLPSFLTLLYYCSSWTFFFPRLSAFRWIWFENIYPGELLKGFFLVAGFDFVGWLKVLYVHEIEESERYRKINVK